MGHRGAHHLQVALGGDGDDVRGGPQTRQRRGQADAAGVGQPEVEQHQVDGRVARAGLGGDPHARRVRCAPPPTSRKALQPCQIRAMRLGDQRIVLDDQHGDHASCSRNGHRHHRAVGHVGGQRATVALARPARPAPDPDRAARRRCRTSSSSRAASPARRSRHPCRGPLSATRDQQPLVVLADGHLHPGIVTVARVHRVVDQVAQHGDHLLRRSAATRRRRPAGGCPR